MVQLKEDDLLKSNFCDILVKHSHQPDTHTHIQTKKRESEREKVNADEVH